MKFWEAFLSNQRELASEETCHQTVKIEIWMEPKGRLPPTADLVFPFGNIRLPEH